MTHQIKNDGANFELSIEQLDDVAGGNWLGDFSRWVGHEVKSFFQNPVVASIAGTLILIGGAVTAGAAMKQK